RVFRLSEGERAGGYQGQRRQNNSQCHPALHHFILPTGVTTFSSAHSQACPARERVDMNFNLMPFTVLLQIGRKVTDTILEAKFESNGCGGINHFLIFPAGPPKGIKEERI